MTPPDGFVAFDLVRDDLPAVGDRVLLRSYIQEDPEEVVVTATDDPDGALNIGSDEFGYFPIGEGDVRAGHIRGVASYRLIEAIDRGDHLDGGGE